MENPSFVYITIISIEGVGVKGGQKIVEEAADILGVHENREKWIAT